MATASSDAAPRSSDRSSTSTSSSPPLSSSSASLSSAHAHAIAGTLAPPPAASSSAYCRSLLFGEARRRRCLHVLRHHQHDRALVARCLAEVARDARLGVG